MKERTGSGKIKSVITRGKGAVAGADGKPVETDVEIPVKKAEEPEEKKEKE